MDNHYLVKILDCNLEQLNGKSASLFRCEGCEVRNFCENANLPFLINCAIQEIEKNMQEERETIEFATYIGSDFEHGLRRGQDYRIRIETRSSIYRVYANDGSMESDLLLTYNRMSEILNNWRFIQ